MTRNVRKNVLWRGAEESGRDETRFHTGVHWQNEKTERQRIDKEHLIKLDMKGFTARRQFINWVHSFTHPNGFRYISVSRMKQNGIGKLDFVREGERERCHAWSEEN